MPKKNISSKRPSARCFQTASCTIASRGLWGPLANWLRTDLNKYLRQQLQPERIAKHGLFDIQHVNRLMDEHEKKVENHDNLLWAILIFQKWYDRYILNSPLKDGSIYTG